MRSGMKVSRTGTADMEIAPVAQPVEQSPCKGKVARSIRRLGHHQPPL